MFQRAVAGRILLFILSLQGLPVRLILAHILSRKYFVIQRCEDYLGVVLRCILVLRRMVQAGDGYGRAAAQLVEDVGWTHRFLLHVSRTVLIFNFNGFLAAVVAIICFPLTALSVHCLEWFHLPWRLLIERL